MHRVAASQGVRCWTIAHNATLGPRLWLSLSTPWRQRLENDRGVVLHLHHSGELKFHWPWLRNRRFLKKILQFHLWVTHSKKNAFHRFLYGGVDEIWSSSQSAQEQLQKLLPVPAQKFCIVPYGREVTRLLALRSEKVRRDFRAKLRIPENAIVGLTVARFEPIKGVREVFDGFVAVAGQMPQAHLVLVGGPSPENQSAEVYAHELKQQHQSLPPEMSARIHFTGFLPQSDEAMAACDYYVLPSYEECMSLALLDALILGLPVIGTDAGGTPSVVVTGKTGILVPARDAGAIGAAIKTMVTESQNREQWAAQARLVGAPFDREGIFRSIVKRYLS